MKYVLTILAVWGNDITLAKAKIDEILAAADAPDAVKQKLADFFLSLESPFSGGALQAIVAGFVAEILSGAPGFNPQHGGLA